MIHIRIATTTTITNIPTATPALKIPVITEQLLKKVIASKTSKKVNFFIIKLQRNRVFSIQILLSSILFFLKFTGITLYKLKKK